ncbi:hypothetical protein PR003_g9515 [Phytophthora rubi]|uniref:Integrase catalytic domain-containing protein n=1 Tax=Phytophthora rubi TaxID=129364 RepID=A0A6A4FMR7_9STRA|nr:hypothetical protein PR003_g9515 [Phytophthora rubi]
MRIFEVYRCNKVLMIDAMGEMTTETRVNAVTEAVKAASESLEDAVTESTLLELHKRLGHIARGNKYLINFIDYSTNYVCVFLTKNKADATKEFEHFLVYFEKRFNCRIHVQRTDGGKEYVNVDPFCKETGVRRQISERENQASNGKA